MGAKIKRSQINYLLHYCGNETYDIVCDKTHPDDPVLKTYDNIIKIIKDFYNPEPIEIMEIFRFHKRYQEEDESVKEFLTALQKMSMKCNMYLETYIRNQFVCGL